MQLDNVLTFLKINCIISFLIFQFVLRIPNNGYNYRAKAEGYAFKSPLAKHI